MKSDMKDGLDRQKMERKRKKEKFRQASDALQSLELMVPHDGIEEHARRRWPAALHEA